MSPVGGGLILAPDKVKALYPLAIDMERRRMARPTMLDKRAPRQLTVRFGTGIGCPTAGMI